MFKIGEFSKISQVSMRMLRHYDEIGLFKPAQIDAQTGYRYYSVNQLPRLNRIVALKELGLSLEEVRHVLHDDITASELTGLLKAKRAKLEQHLLEERHRLARVESRLKQIEEEGEMPRQEAVIKAVEAHHLLAIRETAPSFKEMDSLILETRQAVQRAHIEALGPGLALFYDPGFEETQVDWELGFVVRGPHPKRLELSGNRAMTVRLLPEIEAMACLIYEGPFVGLHRGYSALGTWIEENGYSIAGTGREVFWQLDLEDPSQNVTELQFPVQRA